MAGRWVSTGAGFGAALRPGPPAPDPASADRWPGPTLFLSLFFLVSGGKREQENKRKAIRFRLLVVWGAPRHRPAGRRKRKVDGGGAKGEHKRERMMKARSWRNRFMTAGHVNVFRSPVRRRGARGRRPGPAPPRVRPAAPRPVSSHVTRDPTNGGRSAASRDGRLVPFRPRPPTGAHAHCTRCGTGAS